jgi:hypothetical protein
MFFSDFNISTSFLLVCYARRDYDRASCDFQGRRQELRLNGTRISDHDLHNFRPGRLGSRVPFRGVHGFHVTIMPKSARTRCGPHHTLLVMNSEAHTYFRGATLVHNVGGRILPPGVRPRP